MNKNTLKTHLCSDFSPSEDKNQCVKVCNNPTHSYSTIMGNSNNCAIYLFIV